MDVTVSAKYQIVIPKSVRKRFGIKPGQKLHIQAINDKSLTISASPTAEYITKYAGTLQNTVWQKQGTDAASWLRQLRDDDWVVKKVTPTEKDI